MASSSLSTSSPGTESRRKYDVFLSFRGEDVRNTFVAYLYRELKVAGFLTFLDDDGIPRGEDISSELNRAIRESRISIVVFSEDYASSRWCLDELVMILELSRSGELHLLPVFYDIDPSHLRKQTATVADAFQRHERRFKADRDPNGHSKIKQWKEALTATANLAGLPFDTKSDGVEWKFIKKIITEVQTKFSTARVIKTDSQFIGRVYDLNWMNSWLNFASHSNILVIYGIGGIGKTTFARLIYDLNGVKFEVRSFLTISDFLKERDGLLELQRKLLSDILPQSQMEKPRSTRDGWQLIRRVLSSRKILLVLDDVNRSIYLDDIIQMKGWLCEGSKIIITTRWENLLNNDEVYMKHEIVGLSHAESSELFSLHAFGQNCPKEGYTELTEQFLYYGQGLPLALKILGSSLSGKSLRQWEDQLLKLKKFPNMDIINTIKISYESLDDDNDKNIFLGIACFFVGKDRDFVATILQGCNFHVEIGMQNLIDRCLLTISEGKLTMHNLIQIMGQQVVRESSNYCPKKYSRLWNHDDSLNVLRSKMGSKHIEGLILDMKNSIKRDFETNAFEKMQEMRILILNDVQLKGCYKVLPRKLKWLCWNKFSLRSIPNDFILEELVVLDMSYSRLKHLWEKKKFLGSLKILNLNYCHFLECTPDFSTMPNLEKLYLKDCPKLVGIDDYISNLNKLRVLDLTDCRSLREIPTGVGAITSLEEVMISGCTSLVKGLKEVEKMSSLKVFIADGVSIGSSSNDVKSSSWSMVLWNYMSPTNKRTTGLIENTSLQFLPRSLVMLSLAGCNLTESDFPVEFGDQMRRLKLLNMSRNLFGSLPECVTQLPELEYLVLEDCKELRFIDCGSLPLKYVMTPGSDSITQVCGSFSNPRSFIFLGRPERCRQWEYNDASRYVREFSAEEWDKIGFYNSHLLPPDNELCNLWNKQGMTCRLSYWLLGILFENDDHIELSFSTWGESSIGVKECGICFLYDEDKDREIRNLKHMLIMESLPHLEVNKFNFLVNGFFDGRFRTKIPWRYRVRRYYDSTEDGRDESFEKGETARVEDKCSRIKGTLIVAAIALLSFGAFLNFRVSISRKKKTSSEK